MKKIGIATASLLVWSTLTLHATTPTERIVWPAPPDQERFEYDRSVGKAEDLKITKSFFAKIWNFLLGEEERVLNAPFGLHVDANGKIYVVDTGEQRVFVFDPINNNMEVFAGAGERLFASPVDVVTDEKGAIYVADSVLRRVFVLSQEGETLRIIGEDDTLQRPTGITYDSTRQRLYVVDTLAGVVQSYSSDGALIKTIGKEGGGDGEFNHPTYIAVGREGNLLVVDSMNHRVQILDCEGNFIRKFGQLGDQIGDFANPRGIAVDKDNNIYVADTLFNVIEIFNQQGELLMVIGGYGEGKGQFSAPKDIAIDSHGSLYIADSLNMRVQIIKRLPDSVTRSTP
ncbi:6-bladed beta-propeller [Sulfuricurvum sp.]|uniref:6-bladed beta-propeller n=1 Tax=Sulfuricurvum sp. TaxID=2025608 RepID=UPI0026227239|nr:6-bladed beta-propeller [Sulfuricurvum sp.]MDD2780055.1 6-bladed beta-propeller [Sulfuricurvum sp.]